MKNKMKILTTNWLNIIGIFLFTYIYSLVKDYCLGTYSLFQAAISALILICLYGIVFWTGFIVCILTVDVIFINDKNIKLKLIIEWFIISCPFFYWALKYNEIIFLVAILAFLITQMLREKLIRKI